MPKRSLVLWLCVLAICIMGAGCNGLTSNPPVVTPSVTIMPASANIRAGDSQTFSAAVTGMTVGVVTWSVNGIAGGNTTVVTISATGAYTAPAALPASNMITIQAISQENPSIQGTSNVTLLNPIPVIASVTPSTIGPGSFTIVVTGSKFVSG